MSGKNNPYTGFSTEVPGLTQDIHGNTANTSNELSGLTETANQFNCPDLPCGDCEQVKCVCPQPGGIDLSRQFPGKTRSNFCG